MDELGSRQQGTLRPLSGPQSAALSIKVVSGDFGGMVGLWGYPEPGPKIEEGRGFWALDHQQRTVSVWAGRAAFGGTSGSSTHLAELQGRNWRHMDLIAWEICLGGLG